MRRRRRQPNDLWSLAHRHPRTTSWSVSTATISAVLVVLAFIFIQLPVRQQVTITLSLGKDAEPEAKVQLPPAEPESEAIEEQQVEPEPATAAPEPQDAQEPVSTEATGDQQDMAESDQSDADSTPEAETGGRDAHAEEMISETRSRVQRQGGKRGVITVSLIWDGPSDLDLHVYIRGRHRQPELECSVKEHVFYKTPECMWAQLDVDANRDEQNLMNDPCENVCSTAPPHLGKYLVNVQLFKRRQAGPIPYTVVVEYGDTTDIYEGVLAANMPSRHTQRASQFQFKHDKHYRIGYGGGYRAGSSK